MKTKGAVTSNDDPIPFTFTLPERESYGRASRLAAIGSSSPAWTRSNARSAAAPDGGGTVQADEVPGEVTNLRLSSGAPGALTITWDAPSDAPGDYRVAWARDDLSYLSWDASNEIHRGSSYPGGADTSLTLTGLTAGETYKVRMRSRYSPGTSGGRSGPWTDEATASVTRTAAITTRDAPTPPDEEDDEEELIAQQQQGSDEVILVSSYTGDFGTSGAGGVTLGKDATQFTTGDNEHGYDLTEVTHSLGLDSAGTGIIGAALHAHDGSNIPGEQIYAFPDQTITGIDLRPSTHVGQVKLERNKKYWIMLTKQSGTTADIFLSYKRTSDVATAQPGWSLAILPRYYSSGAWDDASETFAIRLKGVVRTTVTDEPDDRDFPMDASTLGRLRVGATSTGVLDAVEDNRSGDLLKIEGLTAGNSYRVRAWFGTSKEDSATAARGGAIGLQFSRAGIALSSLSPHNDNLLDDGRASFVFPAFANEEYYVDLVAPAFRPPDGSNPAYTYYGPYMLEIYDLGVTQRSLSVTGQTCNSDNSICTGGTITYSEGFGIKASNICVNNRCSNDPRFPEFQVDGYENTETHEVSVGNNPTSKNLSQAAAFRAHNSASPTAKFQLDRVEVFVHSMTSGSIPQAAIYTRNSNQPADKLFDLEPIYNDDGHVDTFVAPRDAQALNRNTWYFIVFSEGGGDTDSFKLYATAKLSEVDDDAHIEWRLQGIGGLTKDNDATSSTWASMISGDAMSGANVNIQFSIYAGVAP